ncbi:spermatogenesis associated 6-like protein [Seriola aureovittata]|uniref:spermatogenesis associated 6-like protein n=1 Tax=Seriola aureovittata TaxID=2871759 RepID=UPI0024BD8D5F|nr:spermatogenesis associated 6-like protein [Seriola aureovittata]
MPRKALKVLVELKFRAVSCPGVHLQAKDDIYLSMCFMSQYRQSKCLPAVFPLLFHEKMMFEKIFRQAVDPGDIAVMLEYETIRVELVQLVPPAGDTLACFEEDARRFLYPEPRLVPSFSGVDRKILMTRAAHFPGISPMLEFSTKTTIIQCSADAEVNIYPNIPLSPVVKRNTKCSSRPRTCSPQRTQPQTFVRRKGGRMEREKRGTSRSLSPLRAGNTQRLAHFSLDSAAPIPADMDTASSSQPMLASWPGAGRSDSPLRSAVFTSFSSPLIRSSSKVRFSPKPLSIGLVRTSYIPLLDGRSYEAGEKSEDDSSSSQTDDPVDNHCGPDPAALLRPYKQQARLSRSPSSSHREWEEVHERVRGLLTTPKAVRRLVYGATVCEVDRVLARRSISPGPP